MIIGQPAKRLQIDDTHTPIVIIESPGLIKLRLKVNAVDVVLLESIFRRPSFCSEKGRFVAPEQISYHAQQGQRHKNVEQNPHVTIGLDGEHIIEETAYLLKNPSKQAAVWCFKLTSIVVSLIRLKLMK